MKTRDGEQHLVFNTAQHHALRYEQVYQEEPDRMMYFRDTNGRQICLQSWCRERLSSMITAPWLNVAEQGLI